MISRHYQHLKTNEAKAAAWATDNVWCDDHETDGVLDKEGYEAEWQVKYEEGLEYAEQGEI